MKKFLIISAIFVGLISLQACNKTENSQEEKAATLLSYPPLTDAEKKARNERLEAEEKIKLDAMTRWERIKYKTRDAMSDVVGFIAGE